MAVSAGGDAIALEGDDGNIEGGVFIEFGFEVTGVKVQQIIGSVKSDVVLIGLGYEGLVVVEIVGMFEAFLGDSHGNGEWGCEGDELGVQLIGDRDLHFDVGEMIKSEIILKFLRMRIGNYE